MGGRIATQIARRTQSEKIVVLGYPLHPPGKPEKLRDQHLYSLQQDILFIQGENDTFGNQQEMETVIQRIKNARMVSIPHANHSLNIPKKYSINPEQTENMVIESIINFLSK